MGVPAGRDPAHDGAVVPDRLVADDVGRLVRVGIDSATPAASTPATQFASDVLSYLTGLQDVAGTAASVALGSSPLGLAAGIGVQDALSFVGDVARSLKPGGYYVIIDHKAADNAGDDVTEKLHRIKESTVKKEVEAAGFKLVAEGHDLSNPADNGTERVFDSSVRGKTNQFMLKFQKPRH